MVCQGLQSCLEPGFLEPHPIIDKLANVSSNSQNPNLESEEEHEDEEEIKNNNNNGGSFCWSFIQLDTNYNNNNTQNVKEENAEEIYVHPLTKRSSSQLSTQSLEMCTEGLGSETGSNNDDEIMADLSCLSCEIQSSSTTSTSNTRRGRLIQRPMKMERQESFPPPLTLISGSDGIQLKPHREGGRLVLKAVAFSHNSCLRAERIDGRLRLFSLSNDGNGNGNGNGDDPRSVVEYTDDDDDNEEEEEEEEEEEQEEERIRGSGGIKMECEIESEEFARLPPSSRCKEEGPIKNRGIIDWEPVWVAIS